MFGRIDPLHERAVAHRRSHSTDVFLGEARFVAPKVLQVGEDEIRAERFVLAAGLRPRIPPIDGLAALPYLTSDTVMRLDRLPKSMIILGGGYIAAEMSHIFGWAPRSPSSRAASTCYPGTTPTFGPGSPGCTGSDLTCG